MREMKESGIEWIGEIPENWDFKRLKNVLKERKENNNPVKTNNILSLTNDRGVIPYSEKGNHGNKAKEDLSGYKLAYKGDIVMNSMNVIIGSVGLSEYFGCVSPVYYMLYTDKYNIKYFNYIFQSKVFQNELKGLGNGILEIRMRIPMEKLNNVILPIPPKNEQERIANFLDEKITEIDKVMQKTKATIEDYKKYKQSYISKVITKGLEQTKEKKDSNVEYIGKCPKDWKIMKLKFAAKIRNKKYEGKYEDIEYFALENIESESGKFINTDNVYDREGSIICNKDDVVFGKLRPYLAKVYKVKNLSCCSSEFAVFYDFKGKVDYLKYLLLSYGFIKIVDASTYGTKMPRANIDFIKNMLIPLPNTETQERIASHLNNKCKEIDILIENKQKIIEELEQYKKSLIYEYVTGKKEIV